MELLINNPGVTTMGKYIFIFVFNSVFIRFLFKQKCAKKNLLLCATVRFSRIGDI